MGSRWRCRSWRRSSLSPHSGFTGGVCSPIAGHHQDLPEWEPPSIKWKVQKVAPRRAATAEPGQRSVPLSSLLAELSAERVRDISELEATPSVNEHPQPEELQGIAPPTGIHPKRHPHSGAAPHLVPSPGFAYGSFSGEKRTSAPEGRPRRPRYWAHRFELTDSECEAAEQVWRQPRQLPAPQTRLRVDLGQRHPRRPSCLLLDYKAPCGRGSLSVEHCATY